MWSAQVLLMRLRQVCIHPHLAMVYGGASSPGLPGPVEDGTDPTAGVFTHQVPVHLRSKAGTGAISNQPLRRSHIPVISSLHAKRMTAAVLQSA